jgi:hypothetical protein
MARLLCVIATGLIVGSTYAEAPPSVAGLVKQLGDGKFATREAAQKELLKRGESIVPELDRLAKTADAETAERLRKVRYDLVGYKDDIRRLLLGVHEGKDSGAVPVSDELRGLVASHQPGSGDFLVSILAQPSDRLYRSTLRTFVSTWDLATPDQIERYLREHVNLSARHREKFPAKVEALITFEAHLREGCTGWPSEEEDKEFDFRTRTTRYLDGKPYEKPQTCTQPFGSVGRINVGELAQGKHTISAVMDYEFAHRGAKRKGEFRTKESTFEVVPADTFGDLMAPRSEERADRVKRELVIHESDYTGLIVLDGKGIIRRPNALGLETGGRIGIACLVWEVAEPLDVDLCFEVELKDNKTGTVYPAEPIVLPMGKRGRGAIVPQNKRQFANERVGYRGMILELKPSRVLALSHAEVTHYFPDPMTRGELLMKVIAPDPPKPPAK